MSKKKKSQKRVSQKEKKPDPIFTFIKQHPHMVSLAVLFLLLVVFFHDVLFGGKSLLSPDALTSRSYRTFLDQAFKNGIYPLWNPYIFSGMPSFASLASAPYVDLPGIFINGFIGIVRFVLPLPDFTRLLINYFFFGVFTYLLIVRKARVALIALFASVVFLFQPGVVSFPAFGHNTKLLTAMFIPLIFYLVEELLDNRRFMHLGLLSLAVGIQLLRAHVQMSYYTFMLIGLFILYWGIETYVKTKKIQPILKSVFTVLIALAIGIAMSSWLYLSVREYSHYSIRGSSGLDYGYATSWSFSPLEVLTFFVPSFVGFGGQTYWGNMPFTDYPFYMGLIPLFLVGFAFLLARGRAVWFMGLAGFLALIVSFGKEFPVLYDLLFRYLPYFNKFRVPSMILILVQFSVSILAAYGLYGLWKLRDKEIAPDLYKKIKRYCFGFAGFVALLAAYVLVGKGSILSKIAASGKVPNPNLQEQAYRLAKTDAIVMMVFLALALVLVFLYLKKQLKVHTIFIALIALTVVDLWRIDFKIIHPQPRGNEAAFFREDEAVQFLKKDKELYRILAIDNRPANWYMYHLIQNIYGYHAAKLKIYQEMLEKTDFPRGFLMKYYKPVVRNGRQGFALAQPNEIDPATYRLHENVLRMLNVKYIVTPYTFRDTTYQLVSDGQNKVFLHKTYLPRAFFVNRVEQVEGKKEVFDRLQQENFDPAETALLYEELPIQIGNSANQSVQIKSWGIHHIVAETETEKPGFLVLSEVYYPAGWKATIDGRETEMYQTDHILRGIVVPAGKHTVALRFNPTSFTLGLSITGVMLLSSLVFLVVGWRREKKELSSE